MATAEESHDPAVAARPQRRAGAWLVALVPLGLALVALLARGGPLVAAVRQNLANRPYLSAAMRAGEGDAAQLGRRVPANGLQARALAHLALQRDRPADAVRWLAYGASLSDPASLTRFEACRLFASQQRTAEARRFCRNAPATAPYWLSEGIAADDSGRPEEAIAYFDLARTADPELLSAWERLGRAYFNADRPQEAIAVYEHLVEVQDWPLADTFYQLGVSYATVNRLAEARATLEEGLDHYPFQRELHLALADTAHAAGDLAGMDAWYARLLVQRPGDAYAWGRRGEVAMERGLPEDAVMYLEKAVALEPNAVDYWLSLGAAAEAAGDVPAATVAFEQAMALRPLDTGVLYTSALFFARTERPLRAQTLYQRILSLEPSNSAAIDALAGSAGSSATP